ncbi:hypothetical protein [Lacihabitans sp. CCS-44]|uniref:hypothetical protein n=1 Tax=Lacihabitans sp. CCS-44 TaxID=2487331 RepID=UPI0020CC7C88|nr:hypothetical protein [Lacihabitans sp. CCS-44]
MKGDKSIQIQWSILQFYNKMEMKNANQKPIKPKAEKFPKQNTASVNALEEKHQKANDFIRKVKLTF